MPVLIGDPIVPLPPTETHDGDGPEKHNVFIVYGGQVEEVYYLHPIPWDVMPWHGNVVRFTGEVLKGVKIWAHREQAEHILKLDQGAVKRRRYVKVPGFGRCELRLKHKKTSIVRADEGEYEGQILRVPTSSLVSFQ